MYQLSAEDCYDMMGGGGGGGGHLGAKYAYLQVSLEELLLHDLPAVLACQGCQVSSLNQEWCETTQGQMWSASSPVQVIALISERPVFHTSCCALAGPCCSCFACHTPHSPAASSSIF